MDNNIKVRKAEIVRIEPAQTGVRVIKDAMPGEYDFYKSMYGKKVNGNRDSFVILDNPKAHTFLYLYTEKHEKVKFDIRNRILSAAVLSDSKKRRVTQAFCNKLKNNLPKILEVYPKEYNSKVYWLLTADSENTLLAGILKTIAEEIQKDNKQ